MSDQNKVWLITGSSSGFGRALLEKVLENGDRAVGTARNPESLNDFADKYPDSFEAVRMDVTVNEDIDKALKSTLDRYGSIDVLVNNAGYGLLGALEEYSDKDMNDNFNTNFWGPINVIRKSLPMFRTQGSGHIVNMSASAALMNEVGFSIYGAAKAALGCASESLYNELKPLGIGVTNVVAGPFRTDFIGRSLIRSENQIDEYDQSVGQFANFLEMINGKQPGDPEKAARAIISVVSSENPPLYFYIGAYSYNKAKEKIDSINSDLSDWKELGINTDFT